MTELSKKKVDMFELSARSGLLCRVWCGAELELAHTQLVRLDRLNAKEELCHVVEHPTRERVVVFTLETQPRYSLTPTSYSPVESPQHSTLPFHLLGIH